MENNQCEQAVGDLELFHIAGRNVKWFATVENSLVVLKKLSVELPYGSPILFLGLYPKRLSVDKEVRRSWP